VLACACALCAAHTPRLGALQGLPAPHSRRRAPNHGPRARTHTPRNMGIDCVTSAAATVAWHRPGGSAIIPKGASCTKIDRAVYALPSRRNADCWSCLHVCACAPPAHPAQHCGPPAQPAPTPSPCRSRPLSHLTMPSFFAVVSCRNEIRSTSSWVSFFFSNHSCRVSRRAAIGEQEDQQGRCQPRESHRSP